MRRLYLIFGMLVGLTCLLTAALLLYARPAGARLPVRSASQVLGAVQAPLPPCNYTVVTQTTTLVPGTTDTGNHCDDCTTAITLPFAYTLYDTSFVTATVSSNGNLQFVTTSPRSANTCLPAVSFFSYTIFAHWADLVTDCFNCGVFTSVSGTAPNRIFNIEWNASYFKGSPVDFEILLYEGQTRFDLVYGSIPTGGSSATVGVQKDLAGTTFTQYECNTIGTLSDSLQLIFTLPSCSLATSTPTTGATNTSTRTPSRTSTPGATATSTRTFTPGPTSTLTRTPTQTQTPVGAGVLVGHVVWQGRSPQPSQGQIMPITLTLKMGGTEANYPMQITDASGFFTDTVSPLPAGTYAWRAKGPTYLSTSGTVTLSGGVTQVEMGPQKAADINGDDVVNITDFNTLKGNFGQGGSPPIRSGR